MSDNIIVTPVQEPPTQQAQPANADPLSDEAVRAALAQADAAGLDPASLTVQDAAQGLPAQPEAKAPEAQKPADVPEKFLKADGEVDVEKIITSTRQLDEATKAKESALMGQKSVDDYLKEYREKEAKFRNLPNPQKVVAPPPPPAPEIVGQVNSPAEDIIRKDMERDPIGTLIRLNEIMLEQKLAPYEQERKHNAIRSNIEELARKDERVLNPNVFAAINAKLEADPDLWKLKNPHKAAWLEVKDEMRLGEPVKPVQAQPSRPPSPVLGGGTPPSAPSTTPRINPDQLPSLDLRDRKQEAMGDEIIRAMLEGRR